MTCQELKLNHGSLLLQSVIQSFPTQAAKLPVATAKNQRPQETAEGLEKENKLKAEAQDRKNC